MQSKTIKKTLMCELTEKERREYGISLATTLGDMEEIEAQKKREMDHFKDRIAGLQAKSDELSRKVRDGKEWRDIECRVIFGQPDKEHKQTIRMDTFEVVQTERMSDSDLQLVMPLEETQDLETQDSREEENVMILEDDDQDGPAIVDAEFGDGALFECNAVLDLMPTLKHPLKVSAQLSHIYQVHGLAGLNRLYQLAFEREGYNQKIIKRIEAAIAEREDGESQPEGGDDY